MLSTDREYLRTPTPILVGSILAWLGAVISLLLQQQRAGIQTFLCPASAGCEMVLKSQFAAIFGIPLPVLGVAFYLTILGLLLVVWGASSRSLRSGLLDAALWLTVVGMTFSAGLMFLQFGVLRAFCPLCTLSAGVMGALLFAVIQAGRFAAKNDWVANRAAALTLAFFALLPAGALLVSTGASPSRSLLIDLSKAHVLGLKEARVQIVVFSDFQCPYCRVLHDALKRIRGEFPQDVAVTFRHYPLDQHPRAFPAAVAAECAGEQGAFWEYHDLLFSQGGDLDDAKFSALAVSLKLDERRFRECLNSEKVRGHVAASRLEAINGGLEGVPAVFLNGRRVEGALDYEHLAERIKGLIGTGERKPAQEPIRSK